MDKVTQQNAANAEESASAAEELSAQAEDLNKMVADLVAIVGSAGKGHEGRGEEKIRVQGRLEEKGGQTGGRSGNPFGLEGRALKFLT